MSDSREKRLEALLAEREAIDRKLAEEHARELAILFTDIVGSTELFERKGDIEGLAFLKRHNELLFPVVASHRGRVVKTIGDAIMAVFDDPADAVRCGAEMQRVLARWRREHLELDPIHVRIGVHYGRAMLAGDDVFGDAVNTAARIQSTAGSDEVLLADAIHSRLAAKVGAADPRGSVELKGKAEPMPLVALRWNAPLPDARLDPSRDPDRPDIFVLDIAEGPRGLKVGAMDGAEDKGPVRSFSDIELSLAQVEAMSARFDTYLEGASSSYAEKVRELGAELFDSALSDRVQRRLRSTRQRYLRLHLDVGVAGVPWELIDDGEDFIATRFAVGRVVAARTEESAGGAWSPMREGGRAVVVSNPSGDLPAAAEEGQAVAGLLAEGFTGEVVHLEGPVTRSDFLGSLDGCRLLHFAGHATPSGEASFLLADGPVTPPQVVSAVGGAAPSLVFANGCHGAGRAGWTTQAREVTNLAAALLLNGVRHYIGPSGPVADADALRFALRFWEQALSGISLGEAVRRGREVLRSQSTGSLAFGRYLLYGEPREGLPSTVTRLEAQRTRSSSDADRARPATLEPSPLLEPTKRGRSRAVVLAGIGAVALIAVVGIAVIGGPPEPPTPPPTPAPPNPTAEPAAPSAAAAADEAPPAPRTGPIAISVLPFKAAGAPEGLEYLSEGLAEIVVTDFGAAEGVRLIERTQIDLDIGELEFSQSKYVDPRTRAELGKIVGAEVVVLGSYQRAGERVRAAARFVDVATGEVLHAVRVEDAVSNVFAMQDALSADMRAAVPVLREKLR